MIQNYFGGIGKADSHLVLMLANGDSLAIPFYQETADALYSQTAVHACKYQINSCNSTIGDKTFCSVNNITIFALFCRCSHASGIRSGIRLSQAECSPSAIYQNVKKDFFLFGGTKLIHQMRSRCVCSHCRAKSDFIASKLFCNQRLRYCA